MNIILNRTCHTRFAIDGYLSIHGKKICDTTEHRLVHLNPGTYQVFIKVCPQYSRKMPLILINTDLPPCNTCKLHKIECIHSSLPTFCPQIKIGNGVSNRTDGSILIGDAHLSGVLLNSTEHFNRLIDRLDKVQKRKSPITLTIRDC